MQRDRFGLPVTTASGAAVAAYVAAVDRILAANVGADRLLDEALAADPEFALAHIARARLLQLQARVAEAREASVAARRLATDLPLREKRHVETIALAVEGRGGDAMRSLEGHIEECPRDAMVLGLALGVYGLLGFSGRVDHHEAQLALLERLAPHWDEDWWFDTYRGWAKIETGDLAAGIPLVERSLPKNPGNAHGAHARAHGYHEAGDAVGGARFVDAFLRTYDTAGQLHCHISWHAALFALEQGDAVEAREIFATSVRPSVAKSAPMPTLVDATSLLWRLRLADADATDGAWEEVVRHRAASFPRAGLAFADAHGAMGADEASLAQRLDGLAALEREGKLPQGPVVAMLCRGVAAFARGDCREAARELETALPELPRIGGSHAQREVFEDTFIAACLRSGLEEKAAARLRARLARRPSARDARWLAASGR
jgi:hypothetical protein